MFLHSIIAFCALAIFGHVIFSYANENTAPSFVYEDTKLPFLLMHEDVKELQEKNVIVEQREKAIKAIGFATSGRCSAFDEELAGITLLSIKDAVIWYTSVKLQKCVDVERVLEAFYYRVELGEISTRLMEDFLGFLSSSVALLSDSVAQLKELVEDILSLGAMDNSLLNTNAKVGLANVMLAIGFEESALLRYVNKVWACENFYQEGVAKNAWSVFLQKYKYLLNEEVHFLNAQNLLLVGRTSEVELMLSYLEKSKYKNTISSGLKTLMAINAKDALSFSSASALDLQVVITQSSNVSSQNITTAIRALSKKIGKKNFGLSTILLRHILPYARSHVDLMIDNKQFLNAVYNVINNIGSINNLLKEEYFEQQSLLGWLCLEFMGNPTGAMLHFKNATKIRLLPYQEAKAYYWLGRTANRLNLYTQAKEYFEVASKNPFVFYGQLSLEELSQDPSVSAYKYLKMQDDIVGVCDNQATDIFIELSHILHKMSLIWYAVQYMEEGIEIASLGKTSLSRNTREPVVKNQNKGGCYLKNMLTAVDNRFAYYFGKKAASLNMPNKKDSFPFIESSKNPLINAIVRQETIHRKSAISNKGAAGSMQLMKSAIQDIAKSLKVVPDMCRIAHDENYNVAFGSIFMQRLLNKHKTTPVALAAYNAGTTRARQWISRIGDPGTDKHKTINWIEALPYKETRDYIRNVLEAQTVYSGITSNSAY